MHHHTAGIQYIVLKQGAPKMTTVCCIEMISTANEILDHDKNSLFIKSYGQLESARIKRAFYQNPLFQMILKSYNYFHFVRPRFLFKDSMILLFNYFMTNQ